MADGALVFKTDPAGPNRQARILKVPVRDCPDPATAVASLQEAFRAHNPAAAVVWEPRR